MTETCKNWFSFTGSWHDVELQTTKEVCSIASAEKWTTAEGQGSLVSTEGYLKLFIWKAFFEMSISRWKIENLLIVAAVGQKSDWNISANSEATEAFAVLCAKVNVEF